MLRYLAELFSFKNPQREARNQLRETQLELLVAQSASENWSSKVIALKNRERRLQAQVSADQIEAGQPAQRDRVSIA
jgi:hypothetical protein